MEFGGLGCRDIWRSVSILRPKCSTLASGEEGWFYRGEEPRLLGEALREGQSFSKKLNQKGQAS